MEICTLLSRLQFLKFLRSISILPVNILSILDGKRVSQTLLEPLKNLFYLHKRIKLMMRKGCDV